MFGLAWHRIAKPQVWSALGLYRRSEIARFSPTDEQTDRQLTFRPNEVSPKRTGRLISSLRIRFLCFPPVRICVIQYHPVSYLVFG